MYPISSLNISHLITELSHLISGLIPCQWTCPHIISELIPCCPWTCPSLSLDLSHLLTGLDPPESLDLTHLITVLVPSHLSLDLSHMSHLMTGLVPPHDWTCPTFSLDLTYLNLWTCPASSLDFVLTSARK